MAAVLKRFFLLGTLLLYGCGHFRAFQAPQPVFAWGWNLKGHAARISSWDKSDGNVDSIRIAPGETATLAEIQGAGIIRHIWMTTNSQGPIGRTLVIRMYWDGQATPSVEAPFGDFFGVGLGMEADVYSFPISAISRGRARNCWWQMPFAKGAKITVTNEGPQIHGAFYYHIDYLALDEIPPSPERFHAQYRQAYPADSPENYLIFETKGTVRYLGCVLSVESTKPQWWGEGDELIEADDFEPIRGTGTEDYFCDAWGMRAQQTLFHGSPVCEGYDAAGLRTSMYRFHILDPIPFRKRLKVSIEHGTNNDRADNLSSVAFWYQSLPSLAFPPMPSVGERLSGKEQAEHIRESAWQLSSDAADEKLVELERLISAAKTPDNIALIKGLIDYNRAKDAPDNDSLKRLDAHIEELQKVIDELPEQERYSEPTTDLPTDDDSLVLNPAALSLRILERARHDLGRRIALRRGFSGGDEIIIESRDAEGKLTPKPAYEETSDFTDSYAKADDTHLMGKGSRFTYGNKSPSWTRFTPDFPKRGRYEVLTIFSYGANAGDTRYVVFHADGATTKPMAQKGRPETLGRNHGQWHSLGTYRFENGRNPERGSVMFMANPGLAIPNSKFEYRAYSDAIRFVYQGD